MADNNIINLILNVIKRGDDVLGDTTKGMNDLETATDRVTRRNKELNKSQKESIDSQVKSARATQKHEAALRKEAEATRSVERAVSAHSGQLTRLNNQIDKQQKKLVNLNNIQEHNLATEKNRVKAAQDAERVTSSLARAEGSRMKEVHALHGAVVQLEEVQRKNIATTNRQSSASQKLGVAWGKAKRFGADFRQELNDNNRASEKLERRLSRLGRAFLGIMIASVIVFAHSLVSSLSALGGQVVALAGSLASAAGVLGGVFVAAIGQAIPVVGLLVMVMQRLHIVMQAVQASQAVQKASGRDAATDAKQQADATDTLITAQENLLDSQRNLTEARREAKRELEDLILAEKRSQLTQRDAASSLSDALQSGDIGAVQQAQLDMREARLGASRSRQDLGIARAGGPGSPQDRVRDATRQLAAAQRQLANAHRDAAAGANEQSAAEGNLAFFMSQLSPAEKEFAKTLIKFQSDAKKLFAPITDTIFKQLTDSVGQFRKLLLDPQILRGFQKLANGISNLIGDITKMLTDSKAMKFWNLMLHEAKRNLGPIEDILTNVFHIFRNIATAAAPVLHKLLKLIADETGRWAKSSNDLQGLTDFFFNGLKHLRAWWGLLKSVLKLFGALMGVSGPSAIKTINKLTKTINDAADALKGDPGAKSWFEKSAEGAAALGSILVELGKVIVESLDPEAIKAMADIINNVFLPGLAAGIKLTGIFIKGLAWITHNIPFADKILEFAIALAVFKSSAGLLFGVLRTGLAPLGSMFDILGQRAGWWTNAETGLTKIKIALTNLLRAGIIYTRRGLEAAGGFLKSFASTIKNSRVGQAGSKIIAAALAKAAAWASAASAVASKFADALMLALNTRFRKLLPFIKRWGGRFGIAFAVALTVGIIIDKDMRNQLKDAFMQLVAIFADAWEAIINTVIDGINKIPLIPGTINHFDWKQNERDKIASGQDSMFKPETVGITKPERVSPKQRQRQIQDSTIQHDIDIASGATPASSGARRAATKELKEMRREGKLNTEQQAGLAQALKKSNNEAKGLGDTVSKGTKGNKDYKDAVLKVTNAFAGQADGARKTKQGIDILKQSIADASGTSKDMGQTIADVTNKILKQFGAKPLNFGIDRGRPGSSGGDPNRGTPAGGARQRGGYMGHPSERGPDDRLIHVAGGEAVLTGHHQQAANAAFGMASMMGFPYRNLNDMFGRDKRMHMTAPRFQKGGQANFGGHPSNVSPGIRALIGLMQQNFPLAVSSTTDHSLMTSSGNVSDHSTGHAVDLSADSKVMYNASSWIKKSGLARRLKQGIHNPNLAINDGQPVSGLGFFGAGTWADHIDHIHLALAGALSGQFAAAAGMSVKKMKEMMITGPKGPLKDMLQGQSHTITKAANAYIAKKTGAMLGAGGKGTDAAVSNLSGQLSRSQVQEIAREALTLTHAGPSKEHISNLVWLAQQESGFNAGVANTTDSNAAAGNPSIGLMQTTGTTFNAYALPGHKDIRNPLDNMIASIRYQLARYGHIIRFSPYARGGKVPGGAGDAKGRYNKLWKDVDFLYGANNTPAPPLIPVGPGGGYAYTMWNRDQSGKETPLRQVYGSPHFLSQLGSGNNAAEREARYALLHEWGHAVKGKDEGGANRYANIASRWLNKKGLMFGDGGVVPGPIGMPKAILAHGGETILPTHKFQSGGNVPSGPAQVLNDALKLIRKAPSQLRKIRPSQFTKLVNALNEITREEGAIDDIANSIEQLANIFATNLTRMALKMRHGIVAKVLTNVQMADLQLKHLNEIYDDISDEFVSIGKTIAAIKKRIKKTKDKGKKEKLRVVLDGLRLKQQDVEDALGQQLQDILDAQDEAWQAVLDRFDQRLGDIDLIGQILEAQAAISGKPNAAGMKANLQARAGVLTEERGAIQAQLNQAISVGDIERSRQLQTALLENQLALLDNTKSIKELDGTLGEVQSFNTTSWQLFRKAILNGMNGLLPQYQALIPSLQTGGKVTSSGLVNLHAGEVVHDEHAGPVEQHYHFTEPMQVADPTVIGQKIAWEWKKNKV